MILTRTLFSKYRYQMIGLLFIIIGCTFFINNITEGLNMQSIDFINPLLENPNVPPLVKVNMIKQMGIRDTTFNNVLNASIDPTQVIKNLQYLMQYYKTGDVVAAVPPGAVAGINGAGPLKPPPPSVPPPSTPPPSVLPPSVPPPSTPPPSTPLVQPSITNPAGPISSPAPSAYIPTSAVSSSNVATTPTKPIPGH